MKTSTPLAVRGLVLLLLAGGIAAVGLKQGAIAKLRTEHQNLLAESQEAQQLAAQNQEIPRLRAEVDGLEKFRVENEELPRLRSQVGQLRKQAASLGRLRTENLQLQAKAKQLASQPDQGASSAMPPDFITRDALRDMGLSSPENSVQTIMWAMATGNARRMMQCAADTGNSTVSDANLESQGQEWAKQFKTFPGFRISGKTNLAPDEVEIHLQSSPGGDSIPMKLKLIEGQWKLDVF
jgi:cell division protein FtsB